MKKQCVVFILLMFTCLGSIAQAQKTIISGTVTDKESGEPLQSVGVYLSGTTSGGATNDKGAFSFKTDETGEFIFVASLIGYGRTSFRILIKPGENLEYDIKLAIEEIVLGEIVVTASNKEWENNFSHFRKFFLGIGRFSNNLSIVNPEVVSFNKSSDGKELIALAKSPVVVRNPALGYRVEVDIIETRFNPFSGEGVYKVYSHFTELEPSSLSQARRWKKNRKKAYEGSSMHFFRSLEKGQIREEGFKIISQGEGFRKIKNPARFYYLFSDRWITTMDLYSFYELMDPPVIVGYKLWANNMDEVRNRNDLTYISYATKYPFFLVGESGYVHDPAFLLFEGKWGRERILLLLPSDYKPND
ncbi:MAG: carboxypeptidase-like regulatory domain-containing protein [Balneolaceae bacterium]|nr:carboxypeptidase-like regulatory domain-containing protein [Balneolaceae bacterium]